VRHGLQDAANACFSCLREIDSLDHILLHWQGILFHSLRESNLLGNERRSARGLVAFGQSQIQRQGEEIVRSYA
jgi:hypothetical protein